ncbi:MAG TPA: Amuc_1099 family pilus-like system protein [Candidatus Bathyarchaeia archaeon]|nr:Amuc_1099 family pilus-like system protein [Candidatus Bathyarchaeia archaeon]
MPRRGRSFCFAGRAFAVVVFLLCLAAPVACAEDDIVPVHWGAENSGGPSDLWQRAWADSLIDEFGFNVLGFQANTFTQYIASNISKIEGIDAFCDRNSLEWLLILEGANFNASFVDQNGYDWYNRPDGRHYFLLPDSMLTALGNCEHALGATFAESGHMQNCNNDPAGIDKPFIYDSTGDTIEEAAGKFTEAAAEIAQHHAQFGVPMYDAAHVFPILLHSFAKAGYTPGVMILQYNWCVPYIACAIGASTQYDKELWVIPNLWNKDAEYPGHSVDEYRSSLFLAYHMGADYIVTHNLAFDQNGAGVGSLILVSGSTYSVTAYGEVARWFGTTYVPSTPRRYSFREVKPRVVIIKQDDAFWGQIPYPPMGDRLFGHEGWLPTPPMFGWLQIWELLTRGVVSHDGLSWLAAESYVDRPYQVFCPVDGVVVFDETVGAEHLRGVEVVFLTGLGISAGTLEAVQNLVQDGATCVGLPHLLPGYVTAVTGNNGTMTEGAGKWVATESFLATHVSEAVQHVLPDPDTIRYQFGNDTVTFHTIDGDPNRLSVTVQTDLDSDGDEIPDWWEHDYRLDWENPADAGEDADTDGLTNLDEYGHLSDPRNADTDEDGLTDGDEVNVHGTDPANSDTSQNGIPDGWLVAYGLDPLDPDVADQDPDDDGYSNWYEYFGSTDPNNPAEYPSLPLNFFVCLPVLFLAALVVLSPRWRRNLKAG